MMNRNVYILGKRIRFSGWQHDQVARLFRRGNAYYENRRVHSVLHTTGETPILINAIEHFMVDRSFDEYAFRLGKYGYWNAAQCWRDGDRTNALEVFMRPVWRFFRTYILQLGILDGGLGVVFCLLQAYSTYMKFAILWGWQVNEARGIPPVLPEFDEDESTWEGLKQLEEQEQEERIISSAPDRGISIVSVIHLVELRAAEIKPVTRAKVINGICLWKNGSPTNPTR